MIDVERRMVFINGKIFRPTRLEFEIIAYLASYPGAVRSRTQIMDAVGIDLDKSDTCIRDHVKRIRASGIGAIKTANCVGYYWEDVADPKS